MPSLPPSIRPRIASVLLAAFLLQVAQPASAAASSSIPPAPVFADVPLSLWFSPYARAVFTANLMTGYKDAEGHPTGDFGPADHFTYAQLAKIAVLAAKVDINGVPTKAKNHSANGTWSQEYVSAAETIGLSVFTPDLNVNTDAPRGAVVLTLLQALKPSASPGANAYTDLPAASIYADPILTATSLGWIHGDTDTYGDPLHTIRPFDPINRAEMARILSIALALPVQGSVNPSSAPSTSAAESSSSITAKAAFIVPPTATTPPTRGGTGGDSGNGASSSAASVSEIAIVPTANIHGPYTGTAGLVINFTGSATEPGSTNAASDFTYHWSFGDGSGSTVQNPTHTYSTPGTYTVVFTATDKDGTVGTDTTTATVVLSPSQLPGALALWKFDESTGSIAHNAFDSSTDSGANLLPAPEQMFTDIDFWKTTNVAATDAYGINPDGHATASRFQFSAGNSYVYSPVSLGAGQYTMSAYFKSNDGADHNLRLSIQDASGGLVDSSNLAITAAGGWQRVSFTRTALGALSNIYIRNDGTSSGDVLVWGVQLERASSPSPYYRQSLDIHFAQGALAPSWTSTGLEDLNGNHLAVALQNAPTTFSQITMYVAAKQTADGSYQFNFTDHSGYTNFGGPTGGNNPGQGGFVGGTDLANPASLADGTWHVLALTWDGTTISYYLDGTLIKSTTGGSPWTSQGFLLGFDGTDGFGFKGIRGAAALYSEAHSASQIREMTAWLRALMATRSVTMTDLSDFVLFEGDSITDLRTAASPSYATQAMNSISPVHQWADTAVSGSAIADVASRASTDDAYLTPAKSNPILFVFDGANDLGTSDPSTFVASLKAYCLARRAAGWKIVLATVLPQTASGFNANRNTANALIRADTSFYDALADFAADPTMGPDAAAADTSLYVGGEHPTEAGQTILAPIAEQAIDSLL